MDYSDAHIHIAEVTSWQTINHGDRFLPVCSVAHNQKDFLKTEKLAHEISVQFSSKKVFLSFGIHPQNPDEAAFPFLVQLLKEKRIEAIGEAGFDLFEKRFSDFLQKQIIAWNFQLNCAIAYNVPLIVHCRKALPLLFANTTQLKQLKAVVFHSWSGSVTEAKSFLARNINAYFSLGKQVLNENKRALQSAENIPLERILIETDAPYQRLKYEVETQSSDIKKVYEKIASIRKISIRELQSHVNENFFSVFNS